MKKNAKSLSALAITMMLLLSLMMPALAVDADTTLPTVTFLADTDEATGLASIIGIAVQFVGEKEKFTAEELSEIKLTFGEEELEAVFEEEIVKTVGEGEAPATYFLMSFVEPLSEIGVYTFTAKLGETELSCTAEIAVVEPETPTEPETPAEPVVPVKATPAASTIYVNGEEVVFDAYLINDNNYLKLRDIALVLSGSEKQFSVAYDAETQNIVLTPGEEYVPVGGEMTGKGADVKDATPAHSKVMMGGEEVEFVAYFIEGNNYFKLRSVAKAFDFEVTYDHETGNIGINTDQSYVPEAGEVTDAPAEPPVTTPAA